jgi:hypothetical protein
VIVAIRQRDLYAQRRRRPTTSGKAINAGSIAQESPYFVYGEAYNVQRRGSNAVTHTGAKASSGKGFAVSIPPPDIDPDRVVTDDRF